LRPEVIAVTDVNCVEGCGGDLTLTFVGLGVAISSLLLAIKAWRVSESGLRIANAEHRVFMKQLEARADFDLEIYLVSPLHVPDAVIETDQPELQLKWQLGISNSASKAANYVGVNFLIPCTPSRGSSGSRRPTIRSSTRRGASGR